MGNVLVKQFKVGAGEADLFSYCHPSAIAYFLQEAGTQHADSLGAGRENTLEDAGVVWVLSRMKYWLEEPVLFGDIIDVETWYRGKAGPGYYRDFKISRGGDTIGFATSYWLLYNLETGGVCRQEISSVKKSAHTPKEPIEEILSKLRQPENCEPSFHKRVGYSDLDVNRHMNNTKYFDIVADCIRLDEKKGKYVKSIQINYLAQCFSGEILQTYTALNSDGSYYVYGHGGDKKRFDAQVIIG